MNSHDDAQNGVSVNADAPAVTEPGLSSEIAGVGGLMMKVSAFDAVAPGFATVTLAPPLSEEHWTAAYQRKRPRQSIPIRNRPFSAPSSARGD